MHGLELLDALAGLQDYRKCLAFGGACCERMLTVVRAFSECTGSDASAVFDAQEMIWRLALVSDFDRGVVEAEIDVLESQLPDEALLDFMLMNCATNAVSAIQFCLSWSLTHDTKCLERVSELSLTVLDEYISKVDFPLSLRFSDSSWFDSWVQAHPLMREELDRRKQDIELLRSSRQITNKLIAQIRKASAFCGIQPFRRGLISRKKD
ncbi:MAG: DUF416 family protein [Gemmataceae bacterium]